MKLLKFISYFLLGLFLPHLLYRLMIFILEPDYLVRCDGGAKG